MRLKELAPMPRVGGDITGFLCQNRLRQVLNQAWGNLPKVWSKRAFARVQPEDGL